MSTTHDAGTFQVHGEVHRFDPGKSSMCFVTVQVAPGGNGTRYLCSDGKLWGTCRPYPEDEPWHNGYFPTEAEAAFRLLLYTNPARALAAFYKATGGEYVGSCGECDGKGRVLISKLWIPGFDLAGKREWKPLPTKPCPACHGTGGPPSPEDLGEIADWFGERDGFEMQASVLRGMAK